MSEWDDRNRQAFLRAEAAYLEPPEDDEEDEDEELEELTEWDVKEDEYMESYRDKD